MFNTYICKFATIKKKPMRYFILTTLLLITTLNDNLNAQQISSETYKKHYIHEDFNQETKTFKIVTTTDNYFILDKGDYLLSRNNNESEYAIIANNSNVSDFILKTAVRIGPSDNKKASVGIILKAQQNGKGAIIFEINKQREYRIKKLIGNTYQALSGKSKNKGWVKDKIVNGIDKNNFIEIRSEKNVYDVYINSEYLTTFFIPDFSNGSCGLIISPETKARISYYHINIEGENNIVADYKNDNIEDVNSTIEELNKRIKILEENNTKLNTLNTNTKGEQTEKINKLTAKNNELGDITDKQKKEISGLKQVMSDLTNNNNTLNTEITALQNQLNNAKSNTNDLNNKIVNLNNEISTLKTKINEINVQNNNLATSTKEKTKEITSLTGTIKTLKESSTNANDKNKQLNKEINELKQEVSSEKSTNTKITNELQKVNKSSISTITKLNNTIKTLEKKINNLTTDLSSEQNTHKKTKSTLAKSVNNKIIEISKLKKELTEANNRLTKLEKIQTQHDQEISKLNSQIVESNTTITELTTQIKTENKKNQTLQIKNDELKDLFILMDFEINGVNPSEMRQETSDVTITPQIIKEKTIYSVQFGVYMQEQPYNTIKDIENVWFKTNEIGTHFYYSGEFNSPQEATLHMNKLISKGYTDAFVVILNE